MSCDKEWRWGRQIETTTRIEPQDSPQTIRLGIAFSSPHYMYWEYLGRYPIISSVIIRPWEEIEIGSGRFLVPSNVSKTYLGIAGPVTLTRMDRLRFQHAVKRIYRFINPKRLEILGESQQRVSNACISNKRT